MKKNKKLQFKQRIKQGSKQSPKQSNRQSFNQNNSNPKRVLGKVKRHPDGFGFLIPSDGFKEDLYISKQDMAGVMTGDKVEVSVKSNGERYSGVKVSVVERTHKKVAGVIHKVSETDGIINDSGNWGSRLRVFWDEDQNIEDRSWILASVTSYPGEPEGFQAKLDLSLPGSASDPIHDVKKVIHENSIPHIFSQSILDSLDKFKDYKIEAKQFADRSNLEKEIFVTIDGSTAKDFDDAICVSKNPKGFCLQVAIADVSHYVKVDTDLDTEALLRGNSSYFPGHVVPMLPAKLSDDLCSLKPNVSRLALVLKLFIDHCGKVQSYEFKEAVIKSHERLTYGQVQSLIDTDFNNDNQEHSSSVVNMLKESYSLAKLLLNKRRMQGFLDLDIPEAEVLVNEKGGVEDIVYSQRLFAHRLIEEFMLTANTITAKFLSSKSIESLYRVHEEPSEEAITQLSLMFNSVGLSENLSPQNISKKVGGMLQGLENANLRKSLFIAVLRSLKQARYQTENIGHFGLSFADYVHFTSPIRRYPDLIIHRLIKKFSSINDKKIIISKEKLGTVAASCSATEQRSVKAERRIIAIKKARFMEKHLGEVFEGHIASVAKFGVFVAFKEFAVEALLSLRELGSEPFELDKMGLFVIGRRSKKIYRVGDEVTVQVAAVNVDKGFIDLVIYKEQNKEQNTKEQNKTEQNTKQKNK
ncbi:MAG: ribonuclease R [Bdellovibrionales bacterium]|nr:ribonuclease R [Bdellovibrionales bacterium]